MLDDLKGQAHLSLQRLVACTVSVPLGIASARLEDMEGCTVRLGPIAGPLFVTRCHNCTVEFASHQVRVHLSTDCTFKLHATSSPIIEDCHGIVVAPTLPPFWYPSFAAQMDALGLKADVNLWDRVEDFNWLKQTPSPNWTRRVDNINEN